MQPHFLLIIGLALFGAFALPRALEGRLLTVPMLFVAFGFGLFSLPLDLPFINPEDARLDRVWLEYLTEFIVIISLGGIGLTLDRRPSLKNWRVGILLLAVAMPLTIAAVAWLGWFALGLAPASAVLLGSVLAPTDPVLADSVQVGPPNDEEPEDPVRFGLSLEAGLNDGLAFPFVYLAIGLLGATSVGAALTEWLWMDVVVRLTVGTVMGLVMGRLLAWLFFTLVDWIDEDADTEVQEGLFVISAVLVTYGLTEVLHGYGFLAVFISAVVARGRNESHPAHAVTHRSLHQMELALMGLFLIGFGGSLATGALDNLTWPAVGVAAALLVVIRPVSGLVAMFGSRLGWRRRVAVSVFGIRGLGSLYYLAYAHNTYEFPGIDLIWSVVSLIILVSVMAHGLAVGPVLRWADASD